MQCMGVLDYVNAYLTIRPVDTVAMVGDNAVLNCSTDLDLPLYWSYSPVGDNNLENELSLFESYIILNRHQSRVKVLDGTIHDKAWNINVTNVNHEYAGFYSCIDKNGFIPLPINPNHYGQAQLVVISNITLQQLLFKEKEIVPYNFNIQGIQPDFLNFTCEVEFSGHISPIIGWYINGNNITINSSLIVGQTQTKTTSILTSTLSMYIPSNMKTIGCSVLPFKGQNIDFLSNMERTLPFTNKILSYESLQFVKNVTDVPIVESCTVRTNVDCVYKWIGKWKNFEFLGKVLVSDIVTSKLDNEYTCYVYCNVHGIKIEPLRANTINVRIFTNAATATPLPLPETATPLPLPETAATTDPFYPLSSPDSACICAVSYPTLETFPYYNKIIITLLVLLIVLLIVSIGLKCCGFDDLFIVRYRRCNT